MTDEQLQQYYSNLLILQYHNKTKAKAMIEALVLPIFMNQLPVGIQDCFDIETAEGVQLDVLGKYVGVSRNGYADSGPVSLIDSDYRQLIKMFIIKSNAGSSLATIQDLLAAAFPGQIFISDSQTMAVSYVLVESLGTSDLLEVIVNGGYLPKPMAVSVSVVIVPDQQFPFFGFITYEDPSDPTVSPFNNYEFYNLNAPWLDYTGVS